MMICVLCRFVTPLLTTPLLTVLLAGVLLAGVLLAEVSLAEVLLAEVSLAEVSLATAIAKIWFVPLNVFKRFREKWVPKRVLVGSPFAPR